MQLCISHRIVIGFVAILVFSCSPQKEQAPYVGDWVGTMYLLCPNDLEKQDLDSIYLQFQPGGQMLMSRSKRGRTFETNYINQEDGIYIKSFFGAQEEWLNMAWFDDNRMDLNTYINTCNTMFELFRSEELPRRSRSK